MRVGRGHRRASPLLPTPWCAAQACSVAGADPSSLGNSAYKTRRPPAAGAEPESHLCWRGRQPTPSRSAPARLHAMWVSGSPAAGAPPRPGPASPRSPAQPGRPPPSRAPVPRPAAPRAAPQGNARGKLPAAAAGAWELLGRLRGKSCALLPRRFRSRAGTNFCRPASVWCLRDVQRGERGGVEGRERQ